MQIRSSLMLAVITTALMSGAVSAQSAALSNTNSAPAANTPAQMLQPQSASSLLAPVNLHEDAALLHRETPAQPQPVMVRHRGPGFGLMIAGGALFVAGLLTGGTAGTIMDLAGAGIGAYGLYIYFQ